MNLIVGQIEPEHSELFALEFGKIAEYDFVYALSSTNINQSAPNLVKLYITIRSLMNLIIELIGPELSRVVFPWIRKFAIFDFVYTLASAKIDQSVTNLVTIYMLIRSQMSVIMGQLELEHPVLFALEFGKINEYDFVYSVIYKYWPIGTNYGQNVCDHIKISYKFDYGSNQTELSKLSALELEHLSVSKT